MSTIVHTELRTIVLRLSGKPDNDRAQVSQFFILFSLGFYSDYGRPSMR
jgi:hypothetical protein